VARIRTIKPTFFRSRAVRRLSSSDVKLLWIGLWPLSDDEGRMVDEPGLLVGDLWALDLTESQIEAALTELNEQGRIVRYEVDGERFMQVTNWFDHQKIQKPYPSEIPAPPLQAHSGNGTGTVETGEERRGREKEGSATATPFCNNHPSGTDKPCRACGRARLAYEAAAKDEKNKPTVIAPRAPDPATCDHQWTDNYCARCLARKDT